MVVFGSAGVFKNWLLRNKCRMFNSRWLFSSLEKIQSRFVDQFTFKFCTYDLHNMPMVHEIFRFILVGMQKGHTTIVTYFGYTCIANDLIAITPVFITPCTNMDFNQGTRLHLHSLYFREKYDCKIYASKHAIWI